MRERETWLASMESRDEQNVVTSLKLIGLLAF
jgi:hypothetical protein